METQNPTLPLSPWPAPAGTRRAYLEVQVADGANRFGKECDFLFACNGECPKNRVIRTRDAEPGPDYLCSGLQKYWRHIDKDVKDICRLLAQGRSSRPD